MESAVPLLLFLGFLVGGLFLILYLGYRSVEEGERAKAEVEASPARAPLVRPLFFGALGPPSPEARTAGARATVVDRIEDFLRGECGAAAVFGARPTMEALYGAVRAAPAAGEMVRALEDHVVRERAAVRGFVACPSVEALFAQEIARMRGGANGAPTAAAVPAGGADLGRRLVP